MSSRKPKRYVSTHNHTTFSPFDGLGYPDDHFKFCIENGLDAHAITEHGNMNSYAYAQLWVEKYNKENKDKPFLYIPGVEAYFHPDLKQWEKDKQEQSEKSARAKQLKREGKLATKILTKNDKDDDIVDIETSNSLTIEDEDDRSNRMFNPVNRRHHLVLLPKNQKGLLNIFGAVSEGYINGFYRFPRIDSKVLKKVCKDGNVIVSSACLAGLPGWSIFQELQQIEFDDLDQSLLDDPAVMERCVTAVGNAYDLMVDCTGKDNYLLEMQFNRLGAQNLINRVLLEFAKRNNLYGRMNITCDAHYARPELWRDREIYKKLGHLNHKEYSSDLLPNSKDELKCELYPKNAEQIWEEYKRSKEGTNFYDDDVICDIIEGTYDLAHKEIGFIKPDRTPKFPKLIPKGRTSFEHLVELCKEGLKKRGLDKKPEYIKRLKEELSVMKVMKNSDYFITYQKVMDLAREVCLSGPARGSGGGSLVNYVLYITDLDPIYWDLPFARFLNVYRQGAPDIDCVHCEHLVMMGDKSYKRAKDIVVGDVVLGGDNRAHKITATYIRKPKNNEKPISVFVKSNDIIGRINVVPKHKFVKSDETIVYCDELKVGDKLMSVFDSEVVKIQKHESLCDNMEYVDVTVEDDHRFHVVPFNVEINDLGNIMDAFHLY